jgi:predicted RND superfamily exporter protein
MRPETGFKKMIPQDHEFIENFNKHSEYVASPNVVRIIVEATGGSVFDPDYLATLQAINDEVFFLPGVDRAALKSLWTKNVQWRAVSEEGFTGGVVTISAPAWCWRHCWISIPRPASRWITG